MKNKYFEVKNISNSKSEIYIYGDIVSAEWEKWTEDDLCPVDVKAAVNSIGDKDVDIHIYSAGGSVFAGEAIKGMFDRLSGHKTVYIEGLAASIASVIAMCYDELHISDGSYMVIHNPSTSVMGSAEELRQTADLLDKIKDGIIESYSSRLAEGFDESKLPEMLDAETWLNATEVEQMFKNVKIDGKQLLTAKINNSMLKTLNKIPDDLIVPENRKEPKFNLDDLKTALECEKIANEIKLL